MPKASPEISIITPSYNQGSYIEETITSVQNQHYRLEHIVVDGGSTDNTIAILKRYPHLTWISEKDNGQSDAINKGFRMAQGGIIGWLNSDDIYRPQAAKRALAYFKANPAVDLIYSDYETIDAHGKLIQTVFTEPFSLDRELNHQNLIPQPTVFFRREIFKSVGYLNDKYHYAMDYDYWCRIAKKHTIRRIDGVLAAFRMHDESKTVSQNRRFYAELREIARREGGLFFSDMFFMHYFGHSGGSLQAARILRKLIRV